MDITKTFGERGYVFHTVIESTRADQLWHLYHEYEQLEAALENNGIGFEYDLSDIL